MVRVLFLTTLMIFSAMSASAASANPWQRVCRIEGGQFWVLNPGTSKDHALCIFGTAAVGAESLFIFKTRAGLTEALRAYKYGAPTQNSREICASYGAQKIQAKDSEGVLFNLCQFPDASIIEAGTLGLKPGSPATRELDRALLETY